MGFGSFLKGCATAFDLNQPDDSPVKEFEDMVKTHLTAFLREAYTVHKLLSEPRGKGWTERNVVALEDLIDAMVEDNSVVKSKVGFLHDYFKTSDCFDVHYNRLARGGVVVDEIHPERFKFDMNEVERLSAYFSYVPKKDLTSE